MIQKNNNLIDGRVYIHTKYNRPYLLVSHNMRFKNSDGSWTDGCLYRPLYENQYEMFTRATDSFIKEFQLYDFTSGDKLNVENPDSKPVVHSGVDNYSAFELELADVIGYAISTATVKPDTDTMFFVKQYSDWLLALAKKELEKEKDEQASSNA